MGVDRGDENPSKEGAGSERKAGKEGSGNGVSRVAGSERKRKKLRKIVLYFAIEKWSQRDGNRD